MNETAGVLKNVNQLHPQGTKQTVHFVSTDINKCLPDPRGREHLDIIAGLQKARVDPHEEEIDDPVLFTIDGQRLATVGNFLAIIGKAKSKKTSLILLFVAAFLFRGYGKIQYTPVPGKIRLIWFDTEQSRYDVLRTFKKLLQMRHVSIEVDISMIEVYDFRPYSPQERRAMMAYVLEYNNTENNIAVAIIDGIRDLVTDINDPEQSTDIITWLMKVTAEKGLHIATVLHQNKADNNARGHLATELINKAEPVLSSTKDKDRPSVSMVKPEFMRGKEFEPIAFEILENGLPAWIDGYQEMQEEGESRKSAPIDIPESTHREIISSIYEDKSEHSPMDLMSNIKLQFEKYGVCLGRDRTRDFMNYWEMKHWIFENKMQGRAKRFLNKPS